ncbi:hypothetical protein [Neotabrizicola shimadae]|uniref:Uncharacterized protein n=1 Tax=Neotabrizicola shimadae TaxID=2807096 RepID=A0A8G0ZW90_9RHOB|nr:hypothetical protein [Neotabrizicola shimadae]QYZ70042.1 hypothetical protein JO391_00405 [Neotabrizicola shimadae]
MSRTIVAIRCRNIGAPERKQYEYLSRVFPDRVYFIVDNVDGGARLEPSLSNVTIEMSRAAIEDLRLRSFKNSGWQCGDYVAYVAARALSFDYLWIVEPDVAFTFTDPMTLFSRFEECDADLVGASLGKRPPRWGWHASAANLVGKDNVFGVFVSFARLSRRAVCHLGLARSFHFTTIAADAPGPEIPNDESFVASVLIRDGFSHRSIEDIAPAGAFTNQTFTSSVPICNLEVEAGTLQDKVLHPVRDAAGAAFKLAAIRERNADLWEKIRSRVVNSIGEEKWSEWSAPSQQFSKN